MNHPNNMNPHEGYDKSMPIGLAMMLAQNNTAMRNFALMSEDEQHTVLEKARTASSRSQMQQLVTGIAGGADGEMNGRIE